MENPILVEVVRGVQIESRHRGAVAVSDPEGRLILSLGDVERPVYPRSAVKAFQALPLVESGIADALGLTDEQIALSVASHNGEREHVETASAMLEKVGRDAAVLECGIHWPSRQEAANALVAARLRPSALHNNCSGKHAGFVCLACSEGHDPTNYVQSTHPTMRLVMGAVTEMTGTDPTEDRRGIDGCSIPTIATSLRSLARAFARFGSGVHLGPARAAACRRIMEAVAVAPFMVGGTEDFDTEVMTLLSKRVFVKTGAEGVYCAAFPELGIGIALKCDDGASRAAETMMASLIARFIPMEADIALRFQPFLRPTLRNWNGIVTGTIRPASVLADELPKAMIDGTL
jgi:L-asparaginase II